MKSLCAAVLLAILVVVLAVPASASYSYYFTDSLATFQSADWNTNDSANIGTYGSNTGLMSGSMLSKVAVPDGTHSYEVDATLNFDSSYPPGSFSIFLRASSTTTEAGAGTNYSVEFIPNSAIQIYKTISGTSTLLASTGSVSWSSGMVVRNVITDAGAILVYVNGNYVLSTLDTSITTGVAGMGVRQPSGGSSGPYVMTTLKLGPSDRINPPSFSPSAVSVSAYSSHVDFTWSALPDDTNGSGIAIYQFLRDYAYLANINSTGTLSFSDTTVKPDTEYSYTFVVYDYHGNGASVTINVTTPGAAGVSPTISDGRRTGIRPVTGAYWGASPEQIDVLTGNVSFSVPLITPQGRGGWGVPFHLSYNSQNWRNDSSGLHNLGADVGYGYGWKLLAGAVTPIYGPGHVLSYYLFTDSTGAEYRLDQNNSGVWTSLESIYVSFVPSGTPSNSVLYFPDGKFWTMGSISASGEGDAGTQYPTVIEDTNGNQILITYASGSGSGGATNTSARMTAIEDVRGAGYRTYYFGYNTDTPPHLTEILPDVSSEEWQFTYGSQTLKAPFSPYTSYGTVATLATVINDANTTRYVLSYDSDDSVDLTGVSMPYGGALGWTYGNVSYTSTNTPTYRQVTARTLAKNSDGSGSVTYSFSHESSTTTLHQYTIMDDPGGVGEKYWYFSLSGANTGMVTEYQGRQLPGPVAQTESDFTWTQDTVGNLYIGSTTSTLDPGQTYQAQKKTDQVVDIYGNVLKVLEYPYGNLTTPARISTYAYVSSSSFLSRYIYNRLDHATVADSPLHVVTTVTNLYDYYTPTSVSGLTEWDSSYSSVTVRGNLTSNTSISGGTGPFYYDQAGDVTSATANGVTATVTADTTYNSAVPSELTVGSLSETLSWDSALDLTGTTGFNSDSTSFSYDSSGQPSSTTSPFGATTSMSYQAGYFGPSEAYPPSSTSTVNNRWTKTVMDGLGRPLTVTAGDSTSTYSEVDYQYGPCACSPPGKLMQQSMPYAPGGTPVWTVYTYDGIGRTIKVLSPDGVSQTTYVYKGNQVTVTDPAGAWKTYTMDAFGRLTQVAEPDPTVSGVSTIKAIAAKSGLSNSGVSTYSVSSGSSYWFDTGGTWTNRKQITISHTMVSGSSSLTNFPVLISLTDTTLKTTGNGGYVGKSDGTDILFTASDGITKLNHELETYIATTGQIIAWVQIPSLSNSTDTNIYVYYGNSSAANQQNITGVWSSNYSGVWHLPNGSTLSATDSTNHHNGTITSATATSGEIGGAGSFNGTSASISIGASNAYSFSTAVTLSAWVKTSNTTTETKAITFQKGAPSTSFALDIASNGKVALMFRNSSNTLVTNPSTATVNNGSWHYIVGTISGSNATVYIDGTLDSGASGTTVSDSNTLTSLTSGIASIGSANGTAGYFSGTIDEARVLNTAVTSDWAKTEYNNQSSPSTYLSEGSLEGSGGSAVETPSYTLGPQNTVIISDGTSGSTIYYTTDGSTPTTSSAVYTGPVSLINQTPGYYTNYTYDWMNHLTQVSMPRGSNTQTRTFVYNDTNFLQSATNPENGTVTYTYNSTNNKIATKTDAIGQQIVYTYDSQARLTEVQRYYLSGGTLTEDTLQRTTYSYDTNPYNGSYSQNATGRLAAVKYYGGNCTTYTTPKAGCDTIEEWYSYSSASGVVGKRMHIIRGSASGDLYASWAYDNEGRVTGVTYPNWTSGSNSYVGSNYTYAMDTMGRLNTMTDYINSHNMITGTSYGPSNERLSLTGSSWGVNSESRTYNSRLQLTNLNVGSGTLNITYGYSIISNNGKIASQTDAVSGEQIVYTYDALNRLATAETTPNPSVTQWGQSYSFDGFGNLTAQTVILGSAPSLSVSYNPSNNLQTGDYADANGNILQSNTQPNTFDIENRLVKAGLGSTARYAYDPGNKRIWRGDSSLSLDEIDFWAANGRKIGTYQISVSGTSIKFTMLTVNVYFGRKLSAKGVPGAGSTSDNVLLAAVVADRLGSIGKFYPFGQEKPSATTNDTEKFTGYYRDAATGLDYADQRYNQPGVGRFVTQSEVAECEITQTGVLE